MASTLLQSFATSLSDVLLRPCCSDSDLNQRAKAINRSKTLDQRTVYSQYERRLFLRPIMPPTTRRQSRMETSGVVSPASDVSGRTPPVHVEGIGTPEEMHNQEEDVKMRDISEEAAGRDVKPAIVITPPDTGPEEEVEYRIESSGHPNEREIIEALHRSDDEDEGVDLTEEAVHEESENETGSGEEEEEEDEEEEEGHDADFAIGSEHEEEDDEQKVQDTETVTEKLSSMPPPPPRLSPYQPPLINLSTTTDSQPQGLQPNNVDRPDPWSHNTIAPATKTLPFLKPPRFRCRYYCADVSPTLSRMDAWGKVPGCGAEFWLTEMDPLRCKECGSRGVYKCRTQRMVQFEAR